MDGLLCFQSAAVSHSAVRLCGVSEWMATAALSCCTACLVSSICCAMAWLSSRLPSSLLLAYSLTYNGSRLRLSGVRNRARTSSLAARRQSAKEGSTEEDRGATESTLWDDDGEATAEAVRRGVDGMADNSRQRRALRSWRTHTSQVEEEAAWRMDGGTVGQGL